MQKSEEEILTIIKYLPSVIIIVISVLLTYYLYTQNQENFKKETIKLKENYIELNKKQIKFQVQRAKESVLYEKSLQANDLKNRLKNEVDNAYEIIETIYKNNQDKTKDEIIKLIKDVLRQIKFNNGRSYIFIYTLDGTNVLHSQKRSLENKNLWNAQDVKGTYFIQEMNKILQTKDETYYSWFWQKENDKKNYEKIGYFKKFAPYNIFLGAGEYIVDFEKDLQDRILKDFSNFKYENDSYIFIIDYKGKYLAYYNPTFIGKTVYEENFSDDVAITFNEMVDISKKGGGYLSYFNKKPNSDVKTIKYSYVENIKEWNWVIGTGFYMDNFYNDLKQKNEEITSKNSLQLKKILIFSFILTIFLLIIFWNLSSMLEEKFKEYKIDIKKQLNNNIKKDNILAHQSKMAAMGEMIGNIAHQWRQPLSTISTIVTGLKIQRESNILDEKFERESLDLINKHVQYLSQTIDDFRNFFREQKESKEFLLESAFDKALALVNSQFSSKDIMIIKDIIDCKMNSLENELIQVLINILNNARDELINIEGDRFIIINTEIKNDKVFIFIRDNAGGIKESILPKVFDAYFTTKDRYNGTGIGLFMTEEMIIKHLKGNIFVSNDEFEYNSKMHKGAIFTLILPINVN